MNRDSCSSSRKWLLEFPSKQGVSHCFKSYAQLCARSQHSIMWRNDVRRSYVRMVKYVPDWGSFPEYFPKNTQNKIRLFTTIGRSRKHLRKICIILRSCTLLKGWDKAYIYRNVLKYVAYALPSLYQHVVNQKRAAIPSSEKDSLGSLSFFRWTHCGDRWSNVGAIFEQGIP